MGSLVRKKNKVVPALVPSECFGKNNQHLVLDGTTSPSFKSHQIQTLPETQFEERSKQLREGSYPLHMAIANGAPLPVIEMLINAAPDVLSLTDKLGRTCLHLAVANGATLDSCVMKDPVTSQETLIEQHPKITLEVIELLHSMNKNQIRTKDTTQNLPLHTAMEGGCSVCCQDFLVREYPQAASTKNINGLSPHELS